MHNNTTELGLQAALSIPDIAIGSLACFMGITGMVLNGTLLYLAVIRNKHLLKKDFVILVLNRTAIDFVYSFSITFFQPFGILAPASFPRSCEVAGFLDVALACASATAEPILACNRFVSVCHKEVYNKLYKSAFNLYTMCVAAWILGVCSAIPHVFYSSLGRIPGVLCAVRFEKNTLLVTVLSNYTLVCASLCLVAYFNYKIFRCVRRHQKQILTSLQKSKLQKDCEITKFIFVSAMIPLVLQSPATVGMLVRMYKPAMVNDWAMFIVTSLFATCSSINPLISALMVQPLRREWRRMFGLALAEKTTLAVIRAPTVKIVEPPKSAEGS